MHMMGLDKLVSDDCVYLRGTVWLLIYVDDIVLISAEEEDVYCVKKELNENLDVKDLGTFQYFLGVLFLQYGFGAWQSQRHYICKYLRGLGCRIANHSRPQCVKEP